MRFIFQRKRRQARRFDAGLSRYGETPASRSKLSIREKFG
jgi:hypothetical protein